jgi:N-acetylmuramoyl-L-alanine amidase
VRFLRLALASGLGLMVMAAAALLRPAEGATQAAAPATPAPYLVLSKDGRQPLSVVAANGREMVPLDELTRVFGVTAREDAVARGLVLTVQNRTITLSTGQGLASIGGRVLSLSSQPVKSATTWLVPMDVVDRALALVYQPKLDFRPRSRLIVIGDLRVPRLTVRVEPQPTQTRLTIDIAPATTHTVVQEPGRLVVRFEAEALDVELPQVAPSELLQSLRLLPNAPTIAVDLGPRFNVFRAVDSILEGGVSRLTLDLLSAPSLSTAAPAPGAPRPAQPGQPAAPAPPLTTEPATSIRTVVIDPGHGGDVEGAKGPGGTLEKHVTLAVARQLKSAREAKVGVRVLLTRMDDRTVELDERAAFANNNKADLFISLHTNSSVSQVPVGAEVCYLSLSDYSQEANRLAIAENGGALPTVAGGSREIEVILWEMAQMQHIEQSATFADLVERQLRTRVRMRSRAIQEAPFRVLVGANMPAVIVEMGFISNPGEEKLLNSATFQQSVVDALVESIVGFRDQLDSRRNSTVGPAPAPPRPAPTPQVPEPRSR